MNRYFDRKQEFAEYAKIHTEEMSHQYSPDIYRSVIGSEIISGPDIIPYTPFTQVANQKVEYWDLDSVSAVCKAYNENSGKNKVWVLNFASYKNPGGMFLQGSSAQEECLCRESFLYNVLSDMKFKEYYDWNRKNLNRGLYTNRMIISPCITFKRPNPELNVDYYGMANVITCAAPNNSVGLRYGRFSVEENNTVLLNRIRFILGVLGDGRISDGDILILGAFGCGVFKQDPNLVSQYWAQNLHMLGKNCTVIFAVPSVFKDSIYFQNIIGPFQNDRMLRNKLLDKYNKKG